MANEIAKAEVIDNDVDFNIPTGYICTVDTNTDEGKIAIAKALNGAESMANEVGTVFELAGIITTPGTRAQSGADCTNNYLILKDGSVKFSQSDGVTRSLKVIAALWGDDMKNGKTVKVSVIEQKLNNGNTLKTIIPAK